MMVQINHHFPLQAFSLGVKLAHPRGVQNVQTSATAYLCNPVLTICGRN